MSRVTTWVGSWVMCVQGHYMGGVMCSGVTRCMGRSTKGVRSLSFIFGHFSVTFSGASVIVSSPFCQTPFAGLLLSDSFCGRVKFSRSLPMIPKIAYKESGLVYPENGSPLKSLQKINRGYTGGRVKKGRFLSVNSPALILSKNSGVSLAKIG